MFLYKINITYYYNSQMKYTFSSSLSIFLFTHIINFFVI